MSIGSNSDQCKSDFYNLHRLAVKGTYDLKKFASLLPWQGASIFLPMDTPTPAGTQIPSHIPDLTGFIVTRVHRNSRADMRLGAQDFCENLSGLFTVVKGF